MTPAVSVVVTTFNYGRYIEEALKSALDQSFRDLEIIVVDDGSTDDTANRTQPFLADKRLTYCRREHEGQAAAKNFGISKARAPVIAFLDADDRWLPRKLELQMQLLTKGQSLGVVYSRRLLMNESGHEIFYRQPDLPRGRVVQDMFCDNFICFSSSVVRRCVFERIGAFDNSLNLAVDYDLWLRAARRFDFDYIDEPLVYYRTGHANLSSRIEERLSVVQFIMNRFLNDQGGKREIPSTVLNKALSQTYYHMALFRRHRTRIGALKYYLRCLRHEPRYALAWQGLASLGLPESVRRRLRLLLGRPAHWSVSSARESSGQDLIANHGRSQSSCHPVA